MEFIDARRLTGPSLLFDAPGSILDVACDEHEAARLPAMWEAHVRRMLSALGWQDSEFASLPLTGGVSLGFTAPIDALYAASEINEWAYAACEAEFNDTEEPDFGVALSSIQNAIAEESNKPMMHLIESAREHGVAVLWDDDFVSLGHGRYSETWPVRDLPEVDALQWTVFRDVPSGLITGTNGKTTTVRTAAHIARTAGRNVGMSSTDFIAVNDRIVDRDDWSGPGGARNVLREKEVDFAILETARGGLLRRGLGVERADAAVITNIAEDHLGDFGSRTLDELLNCKWIVSRAVRESGCLVLNADDARLVDKARDYGGELIWFSLDAGNPVIAAHTAAGGTAFVLDGDELTCVSDAARSPICCAADIPMTMQGAALHNVANALAAAAFCSCLGLSLDEIRSGLVTMSQDRNPGRCNVYEIDGYTVLVDFAHNPDALQALLDMANRMPFERKALCFGQAGDRPDELIRKLARRAWRSGLDKVFVSELAKYHRGRQEGDVYAIIHDELIANGARSDQVEHRMEEIDSLEAAMAWAQPGDLIVMLALERSPDLYELLRSRSSN